MVVSIDVSEPLKTVLDTVLAPMYQCTNFHAPMGKLDTVAVALVFTITLDTLGYIS